MQRIGVRELRQNASRYLDRVREGETIAVTEHGTLVALLVPPAAASRRQSMIVAGQLHPGSGDLLELEPLALEGEPPSEVLRRMREAER